MSPALVTSPNGPATEAADHPKNLVRGAAVVAQGGAADGVTRLLIMHLGSLLAPLLLISLSVNLIKRLSTVVRDRAIHSLSAFHSCPLPPSSPYTVARYRGVR